MGTWVTRVSRPWHSPRLLYRAFGAPALDVVLFVAQLAHDLVGMLTELGCERADRAGSLGELDRYPDLLDLLAAGRLDVDDHVARADLGVVLGLLEGEHPAHADVVFGQHLPPFVARLGLEDLGEARLDLVEPGAVVLFLDVFLGAERAAQVGVEPWFDGADRVVLVVS